MSQGLTKEEVNRKLVHGLAVVLPAGIFYGPDLLGLTKSLGLYSDVCFTWLFSFG